MPRRRPVTDDEKDRLFALHADGMSRNQIARELGRSGRTVSELADEMGLRFDRHLVAEAVEAKKADAAARRAQLQLDLLAKAELHLGQYFAETLVFNFGGKENDYNSRTLPEPPHRDKRDIASAVSALVAAALKLAEYDKATGSEGEKGMLGELFEQLAGARDAARRSEP